MICDLAKAPETPLDVSGALFCPELDESAGVPL